MQHFIVQYGYLAVLVLMLAESACIPIPSEVTMLFAGAIAGGAISGAHLSIVAVIVAGTVGNVIGSYVAWAVGKYAGQATIHRWGARLWLRADDVDRAHRWFERYGDASVFIGRLLPVVRTFISLPAGFAEMPAIRFGVLTAAGCLPWTAALALVGYAIGDRWKHVADAFRGPSYAIAAVVVIACVVLAVAFVRRRRRAAALSPRTDSARGE